MTLGIPPDPEPQHPPEYLDFRRPDEAQRSTAPRGLDRPGARRRMLRLALTALVAAALGAGGELGYLNAAADSAPPASVPQGPVTGIDLVGLVTAVGRRSITIGTGPVHSVRAVITSATRFTGAAHGLASVRVGDTVRAQIAVSGATVRVVTLQDPASVP